MRHVLPLLLLLTLLCAPVRAADSLTTEIDHLLAAVEESGCTFIRNGSEHSSAAAAAHMRKKYDHFRKQIHTPEDFIRLCSTRSETTGRPYLIRCGDSPPLPTAEWLSRELIRLRQTKR